MSDSEFVFKETPNGLQFVGDFDGLYENTQDPWSQSGTAGSMGAYYRYSRRQLAAALNNISRGNGSSLGLEIGSGHGHLTRYLTKKVCLFMGMDVSRSAVKRARELHPHVMFDVHNVTERMHYANQFDIVVWAQILWYVMHDPLALEHSLETLHPGGLFVISQAFLRQQCYGLTIIDGFAGALEVFSRHESLTLLHAQYDDTEKYVHHDGLLIFRKA